MIISSSLAVIPFISNTDSTRLQMSAKQLSQTITSMKCEIPYVIGLNWKSLTNTSGLFRETASHDGFVVYSNDILLIIAYKKNDGHELKTFYLPKYLETSSNFSTQLRYKNKNGNFIKGDILYEYDCFKNNKPVYGYNFNVAFFPFAFNSSDAIVVSENFIEKTKFNKVEKILIPIYKYTIFKYFYKKSKYGFIPEIGQQISKYNICIQSIPNVTNKDAFFQLLNIHNFIEILDNKNGPEFNNVSILTKLDNAFVNKIYAHKIKKNEKLADNKLENILSNMVLEYDINNEEKYNDICKLLGKEFANSIFNKYYNMNLSNIKHLNFPKKDLIYVIELELIKPMKLEKGDKISNKFANKGIISYIIPSKLRPINKITKEPIDILISPLSVYGRMNYGQMFDGYLSKLIKFLEKKIINGIKKPELITIFSNLIDISNILGNKKYAKSLKELQTQITNDDETFFKFIDAVNDEGLFFEVDSFVNFNINELKNYIENEFSIHANDDIVVKKGLLELLRNELGLTNDVQLPNKDEIIYHDIFNVPTYMISLMQLASSKLNARDFGNYQIDNDQPSNSIHIKNAKPSKIGYMETDGLIAHGTMKALKEFRTVKSDNIKSKSDLLSQVAITGVYNMPSDIANTESSTKKNIHSLIEFLNI